MGSGATQWPQRAWACRFEARFPDLAQRSGRFAHCGNRFRQAGVGCDKLRAQGCDIWGKSFESWQLVGFHLGWCRKGFKGKGRDEMSVQASGGGHEAPCLRFSCNLARSAEAGIYGRPSNGRVIQKQNRLHQIGANHGCWD